MEEIQEKIRKEEAELAEKHGMTYERYEQVQQAIEEGNSDQFTDDEAKGVAAIEAEILEKTEENFRQIREMFKLETGFTRVAQQMSENIKKPWVDAISGFLPDFSKSSAGSGAPINLVTAETVLPERPTIDWENYVGPVARSRPESLISQEMLDSIAQAQEEKDQRQRATEQATKDMAELMSEQLKLAREQAEANIEKEKFNRRMLVLTLIVASLTLIASIVVPIVLQP